MTDRAERLLAVARAKARRARVAARLAVADRRLDAAREALAAVIPGAGDPVEDRRGRAWTLADTALCIEPLEGTAGTPERWRYMQWEVVREGDLVALDALRSEAHRAIVLLTASRRVEVPLLPAREAEPLGPHGDSDAVAAQAAAEARLDAAREALRRASADLVVCKMSPAAGDGVI